MMDNEFDFIKEASQGANRRPHDRVWSDVERKLYREKARKKLNVYKYLSIAAVFTGLIASVFVVHLYTQKNDPNLFAFQENSSIRPIIIETLEDNNDPFYNVAFTNELNASYRRTFLNFEGKTNDIKSKLIQ
jgi:hypothetical protein